MECSVVCEWVSNKLDYIGTILLELDGHTYINGICDIMISLHKCFGLAFIHCPLQFASCSSLAI